MEGIGLAERISTSLSNSLASLENDRDSYEPLKRSPLSSCVSSRRASIAPRQSVSFAKHTKEYLVKNVIKTPTDINAYKHERRTSFRANRSLDYQRKISSRMSIEGVLQYNYRKQPQEITMFTDKIAQTLNATSWNSHDIFMQAVQYIKDFNHDVPSIIVQCHDRVEEKRALMKFGIGSRIATIILDFTGNTQLISSLNKILRYKILKAYKTNLIRSDWNIIFRERKTFRLCKCFGHPGQKDIQELNKRFIDKINQKLKLKFTLQEQQKKRKPCSYLDFDGTIYPLVIWHVRKDTWFIVLTAIIPFVSNKNNCYFAGLFKMYKKFSFKNWKKIVQHLDD